MDDNRKERNIQEKLLKIDRSLSSDQIEGTALLCAALVPSGKVYRESRNRTPSLPQCYTALKEEQKIQPNALNLLLYIINFVGCNQQSIAKLHQEMYGGQETAYMDIVDLLSNEDRLKLNFHQLLYKVNGDFTEEEKCSLINLTTCYLKPCPNPNYTNSLFVHFMKLIEQEVISKSNVLCLHHWLTFMGKLTTLNLIDDYFLNAEIPVLNRSATDIPGRIISCLSTSTISASASAVGSESGNVLHSTPTTCVEEQNFADPAQETNLDESRERLMSGSPTAAVQTDPSEGANRGAERFSIPYGSVVKDEPRPGASAEREVNVIISNLIRFQPNMACLQWTSNPRSKKFNFTLFSENRTTLYRKEVEIGTSIVQKKRDYTVIITAMAEGGQFTICNLQSEMEYKVVIDSLNENGQRIGSATATIPSISTGSGDLRFQNIALLRQSSVGGSSTSTGTTQTSNDSNTPLISKAKEKKSKVKVMEKIKKNWKPLLPLCDGGKYLTVAVIGFVLFAFFTHNLSKPKSVPVQRKLQGNYTVALNTVDAYKHRKVEVSLIGENQTPVEIFSASGHCNRLKTGSRPYSYTFQQDASLMHTYSVTADYFATGSKLMFQANTTAKVDRFNCSSAIYLFEDSDSYNDFLGYELTRNFVSRLCFNLSRNGSYYNQVQSYSMKESSYLYIGLYLPPISIASHVDLSISGTQNYYIVADLTSRCNLSSIKTTFQFTVSKNLKTSKHICVLGRGSSSDTEEHVVELQSMNSFPNNFVVVILFTFSLFFFITIIAIILLCICPCIYFCYQNKRFCFRYRK